MIRTLFATVPTVFCTRMWDGSEEVMGVGNPLFVLVFRDEQTFASLIRSQDAYAFAMAYCEDRLDVEGDLYAALRLKAALRNTQPSWRAKLAMAAQLGLRMRHSRAEDKKNIQRHYDVSNDFYKLFLDTRVMAYSCAYFHGEDESLEDAQEHKVDLICRKLRLKQGEHLLDIGCGWGGFLIHAAKNYGITGVGVTLSQNQYDLARQRVAQAGLSDTITIELRDYRDLTDASFDKIASVGMVEHVGVRRFPEYFGTAYRLLKEGGLFLNHGIVVNRNGTHTAEGQFMMTHIFPNAEMDNISHTCEVAEDAGFELLNMESLRPHYAKTLREWERRLVAHWDEAVRHSSLRTCRSWRLYFVGCALAFEEGRVSVCQSLLAKPSSSSSDPQAKGPWPVPLTPHDVY